MALTELGFKVKIKLFEQGLKQKDLAERLEVNQQTLSACINNGSNLKLEEALLHYIKTGEIRKDIYHGTN